jgi:multiple sugar transport system substrate-binding protein
MEGRDPGNLSRRAFLRLGLGGAVAATALGGCSDNEYFGHVGTAFTGNETVGPNTLVFAFGPDQSGSIPKAISKFNERNGQGITVEYREMPADSGQYFDKLRTEFQSGGGTIDVIGGDVIWPPQFAANGWIADLSDLFTEELRSEYLDAPIQANSYKDGIYGVPWFTDAGMLYYRKDLLSKAGVNEPPRSWREVVDIAGRIVDAGDAQYGMVFQGAEYEGGVCNGCEYIWTSGGNILDEDSVSKVVIGSPEAARGLAIERTLVAEGIAPEAVAVYKEQESHTAFLGDGYVFIRNWPYMFGLVSDPAISSLKPDQIGIAPLPITADGNQSYSALGGWNFFVSNSSDKKDQAWEFIKFMSEPEQQSFFAINASFLPTKKSIYEDKRVTKSAPAVELAKEVTQNARPRPIHPFYSDMSLALSQAFNENVKGLTSPEQTVNDLQAELQDLADLGREVFDLA